MKLALRSYDYATERNRQVIIEQLSKDYANVDRDGLTHEVMDFLESIVRAVCCNNPRRPYTLVAELTYRCPLRCVYCSNPVDFQSSRSELSTDEWRRVFSQAANWVSCNCISQAASLFFVAISSN